jgi:fructose-1,6-bisphosphatase
MYGSSTVMVYTTGDGVHVHARSSVGAFVLANERVLMPEQASTTASTRRTTIHSQKMQKYLDWCRPAIVLHISLYWIAVADFHRLQPNQRRPRPRVASCGSCMKRIHRISGRQAGGVATDGRLGILDKIPEPPRANAADRRQRAN